MHSLSLVALGMLMGYETRTPIDHFHKSQNAPVPCTTMLRISVLNGALWDIEQVLSAICELGQLAHVAGCVVGWPKYMSEDTSPDW